MSMLLNVFNSISKRKQLSNPQSKDFVVQIDPFMIRLNEFINYIAI